VRSEAAERQRDKKASTRGCGGVRVSPERPCNEG